MNNKNLDSTVCFHALISGRVQGVGYRYTTQKKAQALGLVGWVRNLTNGQVEAMVEGDSLQVNEMVQWFHQGSPAAEVEIVAIKEMPLQKFKGFEILATQRFRSSKK